MSRIDQRPASLTRRGFLKAAASSLASIPCIVLRAPAVALANAEGVYFEEDGGQLSAAALEEIRKEADIQIVNRHQCGIYVGDLAKSAGANPVAGVKVTLTSRYNNKSDTKLTEANGIAVFDISEMAENPDSLPVDQLETYQFNGTITLECEGYRGFEAGKMYIEGPTTIIVDTRRLSDHPVPYPRKVALDEWDLLYSADEASTFYVLDDVTDNHPCIVQWRSLWDDSPATVELVEQGSERVVASTTATPTNGALDVNMNEQFLLQGGTHGLNVGGAYKVRLTQGSNRAEVDLHTSIVQGQVHKSDEQHPNTHTQPFNNLNTNSMGFGNWPDGVPLLSNTALFSYIPDFYVNACLNPYGYFQLTAKTPSWGYHTDNGGDESSKGLHVWPLKSVGQQFDKAVAKVNDMKSKASTTRTQPGKVRQINFTQAFHADVTAQFVLIAKWDSKENYLQGLGAFQLFFNIGYALTENFWAGPLPLLVGFSLDVFFTLGIGPAFKTDPVPGGTLVKDGLDTSKWKWDYENTGVTLTINIVPTLSIGVGVDGVASVSLKGRFTLTMYYGLYIIGAKETGRPMPHMIFGYSAQITVVLQFLIFSGTFNIKNWPYKAFYDNWQGGLLSQSEEPLSAFADVPLPELLSQMQIVTDAMLEQTKEFEGTTRLSAMEEDVDASVHNWLEFCEDELVDGLLDDGRTISYHVMQLPSLDEGEAREQGEDDTVSAPAASLRPRLRRRASRIEYVAVHDGLFAQEEADGLIPDASVAQVGQEGGIKPESDVMLTARPVFGDPRIEVVDLTTVIDGTTINATCCFRIGSVSVNGKMRTRLVLTVLDAYQGTDGQSTPLPAYAGRSRVIDFDLSDWGFNHDELYDYDFGIAVTQHGGGADVFELVHLVVVSSKREQGDNTAFADAATNIVFTYFDFSSSVAFGTIEALTIAHSGSEIFGPSDGRYHSVSNIRCPTDGSAESTTLLISYLDRNAATAQGTLTDDVSVVTTNVRFLLYNMVTRTLMVPRQDMVDQVLGPIEHGAIFEMNVSPQIAGAYTMTLVAHDQTFFFVMKFAKGKFTSFKRAKDLPQKLRLVPWPQRDCFLCSYPEASYVEEMNAKNLWGNPDSWDRSRWRLHTARWTDGADGNPTLSFTPIGPDHFNFSTFALNSRGNFIFWKQGRTGDDSRVYHDESADGGTTETPGEDKPLYQIAASRIRGGENPRFSDPFVAAETSHDMDSLRMLATRVQSAPLELVSSELVDTSHTTQDGSSPLYHACNLWYTSVPQVRCVTAIGCEAHIPLGRPGAPMTFNVTLRNDGNTFVGGCHLQMYEHHPILDDAGKAVSDSEVVPVAGCAADITFNEHSLVDSAFTPYEDGKWSHVEDDFALVPGKKAVYHVTVTIPEDWEGEKFISFVASNATVVPDGTLNAMDEGQDSVEFAVEPGTYRVFRRATSPDTDTNRTYMDNITINLDGTAHGDLADAPVRVWTDQGGGTVVPAGPGGLSGSGGSSASRGSSKRKLADTGEPASSGPLAAGMALAGAALLAYERRRAENEDAT